jgi:hypothetical protein
MLVLEGISCLLILLTWFLILWRRPEFARAISDRIHIEHRAIEAAAMAAPTEGVQRQEAVVA